MFTNSSQLENVLFTWEKLGTSTLTLEARRPGKRPTGRTEAHTSKGAPNVRTTRTLTLSLIAALTLAAPATAGAKALLIDGSTSIFPLMTQLASAYHKATKQPTPKVGQGTSDAGVNDVNSGRVDIGDVSRDPIIGSDPKGLVFTKLARDGVCMITNSKNPIGNLNQEAVQAIFTGNVREWSEVPGSKMSGPIDLVDRIASSGTQDAFQNIFLGESLKISPSATPESSEGLEESAVAGDPQAVGFVSFAAKGGANAVAYQGIPCTLQNAKSGQYGGVRNFWFVTKGSPKGEAAKFIAWVTKPGNSTVRAIVSSAWLAIH